MFNVFRVFNIPFRLKEFSLFKLKLGEVRNHLSADELKKILSITLCHERANYLKLASISVISHGTVNTSIQDFFYRTTLNVNKSITMKNICRGFNTIQHTFYILLQT